MSNKIKIANLDLFLPSKNIFMKNLLLILTTVFFIGFCQSVNAQDYKTSVGGRIGPSYGFTLKHFMSKRLALEGLITSRYYGPYRRGIVGSAYGFGNGALGVNFTVLLEYHFPIGRIKGFNWFIGDPEVIRNVKQLFGV